MLSRKLEAKIRSYSERIVIFLLGKSRITPDTFTLMSLVLTGGVVWLLVEGLITWAGMLFLFASAFDMVDGALARGKGLARPFGAFLDSTIDRYSEMLVFFGLLLYTYLYTEAFSPDYALTIFIASHGSLLTSYIRARAEALGFDGRGGIIERPGRVLLLTFGMISGWLMASLVTLAIVTHIAALQRFALVWRQSR
ncbi:MAG: CDP-alcohol phosphatidyltransferase family protein [Candidatus Viridilinea halotolerans]|uniref:CDP-alcohol phosphatidyltransferase family protein n=1 Tax=Candidatus Viridilinea halotolerans TaxID=2491704 RepID=A0A426U2W6_9CHLR|nr:MAG: CDP-alcohol phosphatidyltransferase family protein [Candidatus Viridilinea halotolerans]